MAETVLVTGGTGYVAGWCIVELLRRGFQVRTTVRSLSKESGVRAAVASAGVSSEGVSFFAADLTSDGGWDAAVTGCDYVLHVASPLGGGASADRDALVAPARGGTLRVLRAATSASVKRVVMTSAAAAARLPRRSNGVADETVWSDPADSRFDAYRRSKILAERAAWDFASERAASPALTTILPGAVFGPLLSSERLGSVRVIGGLLRGQPPRLPRIGFWVVDVRDLADLHVRAMLSPEAAGERFLAAGDFMWMADVAALLRSRLGARAENVPTRTLPDVAVRIGSLFSPRVRLFAPEVGRKNALTSEKARRLLGFSPRPAATTILDCAESLLRESEL